MNIIAQNMPHESVVPIILELDGHPFFSGTGFFVYFPQFEDDIFFVTARHCLKSDATDQFLGTLKIPYKSSAEAGSSAIKFECFLETKYRDSEDQNMEDIIVGVIERTTPENYRILRGRALRVLNQDCVNSILEKKIEFNGNFRALGFPSLSKEIIYDEESTPISSICQSRGFYGKFKKYNCFYNWYEMNNISWKEDGIDGFSGSPIIELIPRHYGSQELEAIPLGVLVTENHFISINAVTNTIANYFLEVRKETPE
ncbi:hypothetical protein J8Z69_00280 [Acinetobacter nosocomialis]|uniref:hypothetical protein n=1 Tax=Acinetobacter nosocomialis TaxID=106654 RepID=UPI001AE141B2|nr:hypothetical protein [Acinetobacter nosocomialis]MBP1492740.1 hypothetical protein [Acinetobacter nosocomialis]